MSEDLTPEDVAVLEAVHVDGRIAIRSLASQLSMPETTVRDRLHRLERDGFVRGYRAIVNPEALGRQLQAWLIVEVPRQNTEAAQEAIAAEQAVERAHLLPGRPEGLAIRMAARSTSSLVRHIEKWSRKYGLRVKESIPLAALDGTSDEASEDEAKLFSILRETF